MEKCSEKSGVKALEENEASDTVIGIYGETQRDCMIDRKKLERYIAEEKVMEFSTVEDAVEWFRTYDDFVGDHLDLMKYQGNYGFSIGEKRYHILYDDAMDVIICDNDREDAMVAYDMERMEFFRDKALKYDSFDMEMMDRNGNPIYYSFMSRRAGKAKIVYGVRALDYRECKANLSLQADVCAVVANGTVFLTKSEASCTDLKLPKNMMWKDDYCVLRTEQLYQELYQQVKASLAGAEAKWGEGDLARMRCLARRCLLEEKKYHFLEQRYMEQKIIEELCGYKDLSNEAKCMLSREDERLIQKVAQVKKVRELMESRDIVKPWESELGKIIRRYEKSLFLRVEVSKDGVTTTVKMFPWELRDILYHELPLQDSCRIKVVEALALFKRPVYCADIISVSRRNRIVFKSSANA